MRTLDGMTVLVVDDEPAVAKLVRTILLRDGYNVWVACNGEEALAFARDYGASIDLLLTDVMMPGMSGTELAAALSQLCPGMSTIYMSGYMTELLAEEALRPGTNFIAKPFHNDALSDFVARVLAVPSASVG